MSNSEFRIGKSDKKIKSHSRVTAILLVVLLLLMFSLFRFLSEEKDPELSKELTVSVDSGFYDKDLTITAKAPAGTEIYYTDNCEEPNKENAIPYTEPIRLEVPDEEAERIHVLRFKAYFPDGTESGIMNRTYFLGEEIEARYTTNVLHITGEPEDLFGYENGIFVGGKRFDQFVEANPDAHFGGGIDANFEMRGRESERGVFVEYFTEDGESLFSQNAGVRIHGGATRMKNQKSFQLYARSEYDIQNRFEYPVIRNLTSQVDGTIAEEHKRLIVRSGGTDNGFAYIRSELTGVLASEAGFPDVMHAEPVCVYINGMYRGVYWLENNFDAQYFENRYGEYTGEFAVVGGSDQEKEPDDTYQEYVDEYNEMYTKFSTADLSVDANFEELERMLDVENYLQYFAIQNYVGNGDWPSNNLKVYRYVAPDGQYTADSAFDGRYRHLLYDTDYGLGLLLEKETVGTTADEFTLDRILEESPLFAALMERAECRDYFVQCSLDLMNGVMSLGNVERNLAAMHSSRSEELRYMLEETDIQKDTLWTWERESVWTYENVEKSYQDILNFAGNRPRTVLSDMISTFDFEYADAYILNVSKGNCFSNVDINGMVVSDAVFSGTYLLNIPVKLTPCLTRNEVFEHWVVNGNVVEEQELIITPSDLIEQQVNVELVVHDTEAPVLQISALKSNGNNDFIELTNFSNQSITTNGYFLSDNDDMYKYKLPNMTILPGESKRFYGKNCALEESLGELELNFNLKKDEQITLSHNEAVLETVRIPDLSENGVYRYDVKTQEFKEIIK
ncbi:MAG: CotH kinase family protein [Lachnospiraceae bacterium]|nr:CotH kinase family protein [Lachnospiraceae bacterium]